MIRKYDKANRFASIFDPDTGFYMRTGVLDEDGVDTGVDPFMCSYPELLDIGIMQTCVCSNRCNVDCYQKAKERTGSNMSLKDFESILKQSKGKLFQCLEENEIVLIYDDITGLVSSKQMKNVKVGDKIFIGNNSFAKITALNKKVDKTMSIKLSNKKSIIATPEHKFPLADGRLQTVNKLVIGDELMRADKFDLSETSAIDLVKEIFRANLEDKFYIKGDLIKKEYGKYNKTICLSEVANTIFLKDYSNCEISQECCKYTLPTILPITESLMILLGHYVGNGSSRTYVVNSKQANMIKKIEEGLNENFTNFTYSKKNIKNTTIIELSSKLLHKWCFDKMLGCRTEDGQKQLPNFIFNLSFKMKETFLRGYFCDGNFKIRKKDGLYGSITFNTSSLKLKNDLCLLLDSMNVGYHISSQNEENAVFSKTKDLRIIHRKKRYRISISNLNEIIKIPNVVKDHRNWKLFEPILLAKRNKKYLRDYNRRLIVEDIHINKIKQNVIDINIDSDDRLFITSHGIISHNCALGGAGDVDTHEHFEEILKLCREYDIVPNFTTSGIAMTKEKTEICKKYCGAVAVSEHFSDYTEKALDMLLEAGVKTSIHYVLSNKSIDTAIERLKSDSFKQGINAVVFLLYKPVGYGKEENVLTIDNPKVKEFFKLIDNGNFHHKIGFDSCSCAGILNLTKHTNIDTLDYCEGGRFSAYIDANMNMMPCSFANQDPGWVVSLREKTIEEAWNSEIFEKFRYSLRHSCPDCPSREYCGGGCPLVNEITLCNRKEKRFKEKH